jgi:hypothetical protein
MAPVDRVNALRARLARLSRRPSFGLSPEMKNFIDTRTPAELDTIAAYRRQLVAGGPVDLDLAERVEPMLAEHRGRIAP